MSNESLRERYQTLAEQWQQETFVHNIGVSASHPLYQQIVDLGSEALPYILEDVRDGKLSGLWGLILLHDITGIVLDVEEIAGVEVELRKRLLEWGICYLNSPE